MSSNTNSHCNLNIPAYRFYKTGWSSGLPLARLCCQRKSLITLTRTCFHFCWQPGWDATWPGFTAPNFRAQKSWHHLHLGSWSREKWVLRPCSWSCLLSVHLTCLKSSDFSSVTTRVASTAQLVLRDHLCACLNPGVITHSPRHQPITEQRLP